MENNVTTFGDLFKKSFLEIFPDAIDPWSLVLTLAMSPPSPLGKDCLLAFLFGGGLCAGAQGLCALYQAWGLPLPQARTAVSLSLIFLSALLTALGWYDQIAKYAGAGTLVPITGFANSVVSPAMEFKSEGLVTGLGAKLFTVAGPVLVFGITASVVYGLALVLLQALGVPL